MLVCTEGDRGAENQRSESRTRTDTHSFIIIIIIIINQPSMKRTNRPSHTDTHDHHRRQAK